MEFLQHSYTKIGENRGKKRIWLQGLRLASAGFENGTRYNVEYDVDNGFIRLVVDACGERIVSGRKQADKITPVVDLCNADIINITQGEERVRVDFAKNFIQISIHHHAKKETDRENRLRFNLTNKKITEGSICAGGGVAALAIKEGLTTQGIDTSVAWVVDRERKYLQVACDNNTAIDPNTTIFEANLEEVETELLTPVDLLQVSLPCTGHSVAGKTSNKIKFAEAHKTDATALFGFLRIVEAVNPSIIISENVSAARQSPSYLLIKGMLDALGYYIHEVDLDATQAGSFEHRKRYWFVAVSKGLSQLDLSKIPTFTPQYQTLGDALENVNADDKSWSENNYLKVKAIRDKANGKGFQRQLVNEQSTKVGCIGRGYSKRRNTEPMLVRGDNKERLLTPVEHARVKGVPESLIKNVGATTAHEILGQSILFNHAVGLASLLPACVLPIDPMSSLCDEHLHLPLQQSLFN